MSAERDPKPSLPPETLIGFPPAAEARTRSERIVAYRTEVVGRTRSDVVPAHPTRVSRESPPAAIPAAPAIPPAALIEAPAPPVTRSGLGPRVMPLLAPASVSPLTRPPPSSEGPPRIDEAQLALLQQCFTEVAGPDSRIDARELKQSLDVSDAFLAERVLAVFDRNRDGLVSRVEFLQGIPRLLFGSLRDKLRFAFRVHDLNADGVIDRVELEHMLELGLAENGVPASPEVVERFVTVLLDAADRNRDACLGFDEFETVANQHPEISGLIARAEANWVAPHGELASVAPPDAPGAWQRATRFLDNNRAPIAFLTVWILANAGLFVHAALEYQALGANHAIMLARGCGACLNLNGALVALPLARRFVAWLRTTPLVHVLPVDDAVGFHRLLGSTLFGLSLVHTAAHFVNYHVATTGIAASLFGTSAGRTGLALLVVFAVMWVFSRPSVRASRRFELFWRTHLVYPAWFVLLLLHGPVFWKWASVPLVIFGVDRLRRLPRSATRTEVLASTPLASGVTQLVLEKPPGFVHRAGDFLFFKLPAIAKHEWHPFTISSAPESSLLTLHVRSLGNFTTSLFVLAKKRRAEPAPPILPAYIDGPFGTASAGIFAAKRAVLIGAGIGVTPFASVLESIVFRDRTGAGSLEKVYFYWLNRDAQSFEWFAALLAELERIDQRQLVDVRIFMTRGRGDVTTALLNLAREVAHALGDPDVITGLRAITGMGAPDWRAELAQIAGHDPGAVDVFFCGPPGLARIVKRACGELRLRFHQEHF